jgi:hypothetical protein
MAKRKTTPKPRAGKAHPSPNLADLADRVIDANNSIITLARELDPSLAAPGILLLAEIIDDSIAKIAQGVSGVQS